MALPQSFDYVDMTPLVDHSNRGAGPWQAHALLLVSCLPILGMLVVAPILPDMQRHFQAVAGVAYLVPLALTAPAISIVLLSPFVGLIASWSGRKRLLVAALLAYAVAATAPLYLNSLFAIIGSRLLVGASEAMLMTTATMLIGDYFSGSRRDRYLSLQVLYTSVSAVLFLLIGGVLGEAGWRVPFVAYFAPLILLPLIARVIWEPQAPVKLLERSPDRVPWRAILPLFVITFFAGGCMNLMSVEMGYLLEGVGTTSSGMKGVAAAANSAGIALGAASMAHLGNPSRLGQLLLALLVGSVGFGVVATAQNSATVIVGGSIAGLASGFYLGWLLAAVNRPLTFENRGRAVGVWISCYFLATVLAPVTAVALSGVFGTLQASMYVFAGILLTMILVALAMMRSRNEWQSNESVS